jgi:hypothetical protein
MIAIVYMQKYKQNQIISLMLLNIHAQERASFLKSAVRRCRLLPEGTSHCPSHSLPSRTYTNIDLLLRHNTHFSSPRRIES